MNHKESNNELNDLEKQLEEVDEWQKNANNPGYYVGTGKVPVPIKNSLKSPTIMLAIGIIFLIPSIYNLVINFHIYSLSVDLMPLIIGGILFAGGIIRLSKK